METMSTDDGACRTFRDVIEQCPNARLRRTPCVVTTMNRSLARDTMTRHGERT